MPAIGANGGIQRGARLPGAPPPKAPPPPPKPTAKSLALANRVTAPIAAAAHPISRGSVKPQNEPALRNRVQSGIDVAKTVPTHYQAVRDTFAHQPLATQVKIYQGVKAGRADPVTARAVTAAVKALPEDRQMQVSTLAITGGKDANQQVSDVLGKGLNALQGLHSQATSGPEGRVSQEGLSAGKFGTIAVHEPVDLVRAALEKPAVIPSTVKGLGEAALGATAGMAELPVKAVENGPGQAFTDLYHGLKNDYNARYGPLAAGNDRAFINRIKASPQGAGPEALDALGLVSGLDATAGRAVSQVARTAAKLSGSENILTRARPALRIAGGETRPQELSGMAGRALAQRGEDALRRGKERLLPGEIKHGGQEVRPLFGNRSQRILTSHVASKYRNLMARKLNVEVRNGATRGIARMSAWERRAFPVVGEGMVRLRSGKQAAIEDLEARMKDIRNYRAGNPKSVGNHIPAEYADRVDELRYLQNLKDNVDKWLTPRLAKVVDQEGQRGLRIEANLPDSFVRRPVAEARRLRAQGEHFGVEHPDEIAARGGDLTGRIDTGGKPVLGTANAIRERAAQEAEVAARQGAHHPVSTGPNATGRVGSLEDLLHASRAADSKADVARFEKQLNAARAPKPARGLAADLSRARNMATAAEKAKLLEHYDELRPGLLQDYSARVRAIAKDRGYPEQPVFFHHTDIPEEKFGDFTTGMGHRAMPGPHRSAFELHKSGAIWRDPRVYTAGLARAIKVGHQWPMVDEMLRRAGFPEPSAAAIRAAGFGGRRADTLTGREYLKAMMADGHKAENLHLYNPGRLRESTMQERGIGGTRRSDRLADTLGGNRHVPEEGTADRLLHDLLKEHSTAAEHAPTSGSFVKDAGWKALPPAAFKEIHSSLQPSALPGRLVGKVQGTAAHMILGGSPSFLVMNTLAHMILASFGTRGRLLTDAAKMPFWWHGLTEEERGIVDAHAGGRVQGRTDRLGSTTPRKLADSWDRLKQRGIGRFTVGHVTTLANPFHALFKAEDLQSNFFRRTVFYSATKRAALNSMAKDMAHMQSAMNRLEHVFKVGPKDQMLAQLSNMHTVEELGRATVNAMGDYTRFTSFERRFINNRAVLFYSFMRHATRTLLYVLPVKHPIATALVGELSNLHNEEVKKLLGGADLPYADSRLFFDKNGKLSSIDLNRSSPVGSFGVDLPTEGIGGLAQVIPPQLQPFLNAVYGQTPTGAAFKPGVLSILNSFLRLSYPERLIADAHDGTQLQQSDSIPFIHDDPQTRKTANAQAYQAAKEAASGPLSSKILAGLLGLYPKPDDIGVIAGRKNQQTAAAAARASGASGNGWGAPSSAPSSSGGNGWGAPATSTTAAGGGWG